MHDSLSTGCLSDAGEHSDGEVEFEILLLLLLLLLLLVYRVANVEVVAVDVVIDQSVVNFAEPAMRC